MPKPWIAIAGVVFVTFSAARAGAQDVRPLSPVLRPAEVDRAPEREESSEPSGVPLPEAKSRAASASAARARAAVLPFAWTELAARWQPHWIAVVPPGNAFGVERWEGWFAAAGMVPRISPHPFFSPWGLFAYEGWVFDRYRSAWNPSRREGGLAEAARWIRRGDRGMLEARWLDAATAYRRVTLFAPELPHGFLGLGAALAVMEEDAAAAQAFRQSVDRWPPWLPLELGWSRMLGDPSRLETVLFDSRRRVGSGSDGRFVAGVLHLFGGRASLGREILSDLAADRHAETLLARGPR